MKSYMHKDIFHNYGKDMILKILVLVSFLTASNSVHSLEEKTFSSTQKWDPYYLNTIKYKTQFNYSIKDFNIPDPPANESKETATDLNYLMELQNKRTDKDIALIKSVLKFKDISFNGLYLGKLRQMGHPKLAIFIQSISPELDRILFLIKKKYNRVRPAYLNKNIKPAIATPRHPSYPSGHSTQAYTFALFLSYFDKFNSDRYMQSASMIAHTREVAGLHFPSDTKAGKILAEQFVIKTLQTKNPRLKKLIVDARFESIFPELSRFLP